MHRPVVQGSALLHWKNPKAPDLSPDLCRCRKKSCSLDVTHIAPKSILLKTNTCAAVDGPNCWNTTLVEAGLLPHYRYTEDSELSFWLSSPSCREKLQTEKLEPGDIIAIRTKNAEEVHGFTYLTDGLSYSKNGLAKEAPYALLPTSSVFDFYGVPMHCRRVQGTPKGENSCEDYANVYTCGTAPELKSEDPALVETLSSLEAYDCDLAEAALTGNLGPQMKSLIKVSLTAVLKLIDENLYSPRVSKEDRLLWEAASERVNSLQVQLGYFK